MATTSQQQQPQPMSKYFLDQTVIDSRPNGPSPPDYYDYNARINTTNRLGSSTYDNPSPTAGRFEPQHYERKQFRQIYAPRQPLYIPAALRPTDLSTTRPTTIPTRPAPPDTPPASKGNSFDSGSSASNPPTSYTYQTNASPPRHPGILATDPDFRALHDRLIDYSPPDPDSVEVTGPPATSHWKPDLTSPCCVVCHATFTWYFRRHHCRKCGYVVCGQHSLSKVPLDQNAHFHPNGYMSRACDGCVAEYQYKYPEAERDRPTEEQGEDGEDTSVPSTPNLSVPNQASGSTLQAPGVAGAGAEPRSLGVYGNWSTF